MLRINKINIKNFINYIDPNKFCMEVSKLTKLCD